MQSARCSRHKNESGRRARRGTAQHSKQFATRRGAAAPGRVCVWRGWGHRGWGHWGWGHWGAARMTDGRRRLSRALTSRSSPAPPPGTAAAGARWSPCAAPAAAACAPSSPSQASPPAGRGGRRRARAEGAVGGEARGVGAGERPRGGVGWCAAARQTGSSAPPNAERPAKRSTALPLLRRAATVPSQRQPRPPKARLDAPVHVFQGAALPQPLHRRYQLPGLLGGAGLQKQGGHVGAHADLWGVKGLGGEGVGGEGVGGEGVGGEGVGGWGSALGACSLGVRACAEEPGRATSASHASPNEPRGPCQALARPCHRSAQHQRPPARPPTSPQTLCLSSTGK